MAIDFPSSPTDGQIYQGYYWDNAKQAWRSNNPATGSVIMSSTTPVGATSGDMWFNTSDGTMFVYYNDGITSNWIEIQANVDNYKTPSYNYVINGGFDIWQRGTTFSAIAGGVYTADRWMYQSNITNGTITRTTDVPTGFTYSLRLQRTATVSGIEQRIESSMSTPLVGKQITVSFWAKGTGITEQVRVQLRYPTAVDNYTATTLFQQITTNVSTTWTRYSFTFNTLTNDFINGIQLWVQGISASTVALDTYFAGVQLEEGTIATPFRRNQPNIQAELAACQRYCYVKNGSTTDAMWGWGRWEGNSVYIIFQHPVQMRTVPVFTLNSPSGLQAVDPTVAWYNVTGISSVHKNGTYASDVLLTTSGASVNNKTFSILAVNSGSPQLIVSAEL